MYEERQGLASPVAFLLPPPYMFLGFMILQVV